MRETEPPDRNANEEGKWEEPECRFQLPDAGSDTIAAQLTRWGCTGESGEVKDHFFPGQKIRLFVEFECRVAVRAASAGFAIRDKTGQIIHGKHQYQIDPGTSICLEPTSSLQWEFSLTCYLGPGEYTVEFGLVDIGVQQIQSGGNERAVSTEEFYEILCYPPPVGRFAVVSRPVDPIKRNGHFGLVDVDAQTRFRTKRS